MAKETPTTAEPTLISDLNYGFHFFEELAPVNLNYVAVLNGLSPRPLEDFTYCELGCGNGVSTNLLAAAYPQGKFWGIDINPERISNAQRLSKHGKINNVTFLCNNFVDVDLNQLPNFDYIVLHNLFSYLGPSEHKQLLHFFEKKSKVSSLLYVSYHALPGWTNQGPIREILRSCAKVLGGTPMDQLKTGLGYMKLLHDKNIGFFDNNESAKTYFEHFIQSDLDFIMRESLDEHADAFYFKDVSHAFKKIHLRFLGSLPVFLNHKTFSIPKTFIDFFKNTNNREFLEAQKDIITNTAFRKDIFVNDAIPLIDEIKREANLENIYFTGMKPREEKREKMLIGSQTFLMQGEIYSLLQGIFNHGVYNTIDLKNFPALKEKDISQIVSTIKILMAFGLITPCRKTGNNRTINKKSKLYIPLMINQNLSDRIDNRGMGIVLASPVLGGGIFITRIITFILEAYVKYDQHIENTVERVITALKPTLRPNVDTNELRKRLVKEVTDFQENILPVLMRLNIVKEVKNQ